MLELNREQIDAKAGETLLDSARRHGSYIWFLCDGRGVCQTCECRILEGAEHLSAPSPLELEGLQEERRRRGYRLGCQARWRGTGSVTAVSRAEELRRSAANLISSMGKPNLEERFDHLRADSVSAMADLAAGVPRVIPHAVTQLAKYPPTPERVMRYVRDSWRVAGRFWAGARSIW